MVGGGGWLVSLWERYGRGIGMVMCGASCAVKECHGTEIRTRLHDVQRGGGLRRDYFAVGYFAFQIGAKFLT